MNREDRARLECSIIIPVFDRVELTRQCLTHLARVTRGVRHEVIVVDNGSRDGTDEFLASLDGSVRVIQNQENEGFAKACNQGARAATGRYLVFLNNDTIPLAGWLEAMVGEVRAHPRVGGVGSKLLYPNDTIQHAGVVFGRARAKPYHLYADLPSSAPVVNRRRELQAVTGACMLVRREIFEAIRGFDEGYRNGSEDIDLCLRIRDRGASIVYQPKSVLYHLESQTPGRRDHVADNLRRFGIRWAHRWLVDEDAVYVSDGYVIREIRLNGCRAVRVARIEEAEEKAPWERLAEMERQGQAGNLAAVHSMLARPELWPHDPGVLRWAARICDRLGVPAYADALWRRLLDLVATPDAQGSDMDCRHEACFRRGAAMEGVTGVRPPATVLGRLATDPDLLRRFERDSRGTATRSPTPSRARRR
jgi:GT2 family glycosyltransferase